MRARPHQFRTGMPMSATIPIRHNPQASRFEAEADGHLARCDYRMQDGVMLLVHTEVPPPLGGRGIAAALVHAALEHADTEGLRVQPRCSYVRVYLARHPEYRRLLG
jgi:predicted GNAT family acetyltransferase